MQRVIRLEGLEAPPLDLEQRWYQTSGKFKTLKATRTSLRTQLPKSKVAQAEN